MGTIYGDKIDEFISSLENELMEIHHDLKKLETQKEIYTKIISDLKELKALKWEKFTLKNQSQP